MERQGRRRAAPALDQKRLEELALRYVERFATTRAKLGAYLARKVRERGWDEAREPDFSAIAERFAQLGYVDDAAYALAKSQSLTGRGYGKRRVIDTLRVAGVGDDEGRAARDHAQAAALSSALHFARRRRLGPFAQSAPQNPKDRDKAISAMIRAGHAFDLARAIVSLSPGEDVDTDQLAGFVRC